MENIMIMPLHLAIERELAYRRRMQKFQSNPPPTQAQYSQESSPPDSSTSLVVVGTKRTRTSSNNAPVLPNQQRSWKQHELRPNELFCKICRVPCSGIASWKQHLAGKRHAASVHAAKGNKEEARGGEASSVKWYEMEWEGDGCLISPKRPRTERPFRDSNCQG